MDIDNFFWIATLFSALTTVEPKMFSLKDGTTISIFHEPDALSTYHLAEYPGGTKTLIAYDKDKQKYAESWELPNGRSFVMIYDNGVLQNKQWIYADRAITAYYKNGTYKFKEVIYYAGQIETIHFDTEGIRMERIIEYQDEGVKVTLTYEDGTLIRKETSLKNGGMQRVDY